MSARPDRPRAPAPDARTTGRARRPQGRRGDTRPIAGDYQAQALGAGFVVQRFWHTLKFRLIERVCPPRPGTRVLDVGCGSGVIANYLAQRARFVDAVDGNPSAIDFARANAAGDNMAFHLALIDEMPFENDSFDQIYCLEMIEHIHEHQVRALMSRLHALLTDGGELLVTTPNYASPWPVIEWCMDLLHLSPRLKGDQHVSRWTPRRLRAIGREASLVERKVGRFCGTAPFVSVLSWSLALSVDGLETRIANPLGNLVYGVWGKGGATN